MDDAWRRIYLVADELYALAPWRWMEDDELFGVQDPNTGEIGFMQVIGQAGTQFGISRYPGADGLRTLHSLYASDIDDPAAGSEILLNSCQLQLSWEDHEDMDRRDKQLIKKLGLKYRGPKAWPQFRSYEPSLYPWFLTETEVSILLVALEQSLQVFQRRQNDTALLIELEQDHYLVRVPADGAWRDEIMEVLPAVEEISIVSQIPSLPKLKVLSGKKGGVEIDLILAPPVGGEGPNVRPYFPYLLMLADATSGIILPGFELLAPFPSLNAMYGEVAEKVCAALLQSNLKPAEIRVRRKLLAGVLGPLADELGLRVTLLKHLPKVDEAAQGLMGILGGR